LGAAKYYCAAMKKRFFNLYWVFEKGEGELFKKICIWFGIIAEKGKKKG
jgi:hypothetical protein